MPGISEGNDDDHDDRDTHRADSAGMEFDVSVAGDPSRPLVLMLHGFCVSRHY